MATLQFALTHMRAHGLHATLAHDAVSTRQLDFSLHAALHLVSLLQLAALDHGLVSTRKDMVHLLATLDAVQVLQFVADADVRMAAS